MSIRADRRRASVGEGFLQSCLSARQTPAPFRANQSSFSRSAPVTDDPPKTLRIFLVENHRDTQEYMQMYLEMCGHTVVSIDSMTRALAELPVADCDVLISDISLSDGDGWMLMRLLRLPRPIYAIAMSGFGLGSDHLKSKEAGFRHHLPKPIDPRQLDAALAEAARELADRR